MAYGDPVAKINLYMNAERILAEFETPETLESLNRRMAIAVETYAADYETMPPWARLRPDGTWEFEYSEAKRRYFGWHYHPGPPASLKAESDAKLARFRARGLLE